MTIAQAYAACRTIAQREAKNFYYAFRVLPERKSNAMCAVYAFMRRADDIADDESLTLPERREAMRAWVEAWRTARNGGVSDDPVFLALNDTQKQFAIPDILLEELVQGTTMDLEPRPVDEHGIQTFATFDELYRYCYLVASVVGLVCIRIFGYTDARAEKLAEETGIAFQLTNILRDVKEDAERGRIYLPQELLREFGVGNGRVMALAGGAHLESTERAMLRQLGAKAEAYYASANELLPLIDKDSRAALWVLVTIYHDLLRRMDRLDSDVFSQRVSVPTASKLMILARGMGMALLNPGGVVNDVIVVGGGVAGLAAAVALAEAGAKVTLLERRPYIGGRAYSYAHPAIEETVDSQHVVLGCCTNILDLCQRAGMADAIRWYDELTFLEPGGRRSLLHSGSLPAPAHQAVSFLRAPMLSLHDKAGIAAGLARFLRGYPAQDTESFASWLKRTGQTDRAIRHFWEPVVVGALNDGFERCSVKYAGKVFHESFLRSAEAGKLGIPAAPLSEFFAPVVEFAQRQGVVVKLKAGVECIEQTADKRWLVQAGGEEHIAAAVVLATDFKQTKTLLAGLPRPADDDVPLSSGYEKFIPSPITTIHLWYDRDVTGLDHAVLLDTRIQWMFAKSRIRRWAAERGSYLELVISASWAELERSREEILASALQEIELFFPAVREAKLLKSGVLKEARATFSVTPGLDRFRSAQATGWPGLYLAGDWTATEWPSTMEGAVRSGRLAAGALMGDPRRFMATETPARGLMRWLSRQ